MPRVLSPAASLSLALAVGLFLRVLLFARARARAAQSLRACGLSATYWRPRLGAWLRAPYSSSPRNLQQAVRARCALAAGGLNAYGAPRLLRAPLAATRVAVASSLARLPRAGVVMADTPIVHIACPKLAREALSAGASHKAPLYDAFTAFVGSDALFTSEGALWKAQRSGVTRALARAGTSAMEEGAAREAASVLARLFPANSSALHLEVDMQPFLQRITLRSTFGFLTGTLLEAEGEDEALVSRYLAAAAVLRAGLPAKTRSAAWRLLPPLLYRSCTPLGRAERRAVTAAHALSRRALACAGPASPLAHALQLSKIGGESRAACESADLHCAATLLFAGHDTQSATLSWALLRLGEPGAGVRVQEGIRRECAEGGGGGRPLLDAAIKETLRLHPPAPLVMRIMPSGADCPAGLPERGAAAVWLHSVQRDAGAWGGDADAFRPERWLEADGRTPATMTEAQAEAYMPFAAGARLCPGAVLAQAGLRAGLAVLVGGMSWRIGGGGGGEGHLHPSTGFTVTPAQGVRLRLTRLQAAAPMAS